MREVAEIKIGDNDSVYPLKEKILQEPQFKYMKSKDLTFMTNFREMSHNGESAPRCGKEQSC